MAILDKIRHLAGDKQSSDDTQSPPDATSFDNGHSRDNKEAEAGSSDAFSHDKSPEDATPAEDAQLGVKKIEAVTLAWSKTALATILILYVLWKCPWCFFGFCLCRVWSDKIP